MWLLLMATTMAAVVSGNNDVAKEETKLQGTWQAVAIVVNGHPMPAEHVRATQLILTGGQFSQRFDKRAVREGIFTVQPDRTPKLIDLIFRGDEGLEMKLQGLYELKAGSLKTCMALPGVPRPTEFVSRPDTGHIFTTYERQKP